MNQEQENLYETDFYAWSLEQARKLRAGDPIDVEHVAEEIEDMAGKERRELRSRLATIIEHLLKLRLTRGATLDHNRSGWTRTIVREQIQIGAQLEQSPSLKRHIRELLPKAYRDAARLVDAEQITIQPIPKTSPFKLQDVLPGLKLR